MNKIEFALQLAKDCTYADMLTEGAKEQSRNEIDEALNRVKNNIVKPGAISPKKQLITFLREQNKLHYITIHENDFEFADKLLKAINVA